VKLYSLPGVFPILALLGTTVLVGQDLLSKSPAEKRSPAVSRYLPMQPRKDTPVESNMKAAPRMRVKTIESKIDAMGGAIETRGGYSRVYKGLFLPELQDLAEEHSELLFADLKTASDAVAAYLFVALSKSGRDIEESVIAELNAREGSSESDAIMALKTEIYVYLANRKKR
jgi:hypothetical protein